MFEDPEKFLEHGSLVDHLIEMLGNVSTNVETETFKKIEEKVVEEDEPEDDEFLVSYNLVPQNGRSTKRSTLSTQMVADSKKFTFVRQLEVDPNVRARTRREVEYLANNFRINGNQAYKLGKFKEALDFYTKGLECVPDTPVLYCNRGLCYTKMSNYKRAIMDFDFVINRLDQKCLRAWLCRAGCFWRLGDEQNYERSIDFARQYNMKDREYIATFIERMKTDL